MPNNCSDLARPTPFSAKAVATGIALSLSAMSAVPAMADGHGRYGSWQESQHGGWYENDVRRDGYRFDDRFADRRMDERPLRGCGPRARARGWCFGERTDEWIAEQRELRRAERRELRRAERRAERRELRRERRRAERNERHLPRGTPIPAPRGNDDGLGIALGVIGLAAGAVIANSLLDDGGPGTRAAAPVSPVTPSRPRYADSNTFPDAPGGVSGAAAGNPFEPWSAAWLDACRERFRSFNASTGTYRTYGGEDRFCPGPRR